MQDPDVLKQSPWIKTVYESQSLTFADCRPRIPESFQIIDKVGLHISEALEGNVSIEEAMKAAIRRSGLCSSRRATKFQKVRIDGTGLAPSRTLKRKFDSNILQYIRSSLGMPKHTCDRQMCLQ
jgi:hypothetical protein